MYYYYDNRADMYNFLIKEAALNKEAGIIDLLRRLSNVDTSMFREGRRAFRYGAGGGKLVPGEYTRFKDLMMALGDQAGRSTPAIGKPIESLVEGASRAGLYGARTAGRMADAGDAAIDAMKEGGRAFRYGAGGGKLVPGEYTRFKDLMMALGTGAGAAKSGVRAADDALTEAAEAVVRGGRRGADALVGGGRRAAEATAEALSEGGRSFKHGLGGGTLVPGEYTAIKSMLLGLGRGTAATGRGAAAAVKNPAVKYGVPAALLGTAGVATANAAGNKLGDRMLASGMNIAAPTEAELAKARQEREMRRTGESAQSGEARAYQEMQDREEAAAKGGEAPKATTAAAETPKTESPKTRADVIADQVAQGPDKLKAVGDFFKTEGGAALAGSVGGGLGGYYGGKALGWDPWLSAAAGSATSALAAGLLARHMRKKK